MLCLLASLQNGISAPPKHEKAVQSPWQAGRTRGQSPEAASLCRAASKACLHTPKVDRHRFVAPQRLSAAGRLFSEPVAPRPGEAAVALRGETGDAQLSG